MISDQPIVYFKIKKMGRKVYQETNPETKKVSFSSKPNKHQLRFKKSLEFIKGVTLNMSDVETVNWLNKYKPIGLYDRLAKKQFLSMMDMKEKAAAKAKEKQENKKIKKK